MLSKGGAFSDRRLVQVSFLTAGLLTVGMLHPPASRAAVIYRIDLEPAIPRVGEQVAISVSTFEADSPSPGSELDPFPLEEFLWTFVADSPSGQTVEIPLARDGVSPNRWTGTFVFTEAGRWEVGLDKSHLGTPPDPALGARLEVDVASDAADPNPLPLLAAIAIVLPIAVLAFLWLRAREIP
jgi:hypothetical protein